MSVSSGSDITIPIQDSPPPPPSPYAGTNGGSKGNDSSTTENKSSAHQGGGGVGGTVTIIDTSAGAAEASNGRSTPEPRGDVTVTVGFVNEGYQNHSPEHTNHSEKNGHSKMGNGQKKRNSNGAISISVPGEGATGGEKGDHQEIHLNEAVNPELINMNILNTIPDKPNPEYGPYDNLDEYFVPVNTHKKFLRSEKLYVTKDKRKETHWKKYVCWVLGATILAAIVTVAVLAGIGLIPQKSPNHFESVVGTTDSTSSSSSTGDLSSEDIIISSSPESSLPSSTEINTPPSVPVDASYVPMAADMEFRIENLDFEVALYNKSSERFQQLGREIQDKVKEIIQSKAGLGTVYAHVNEFGQGSVIVKMRIGWLNQAMNVSTITQMLANVTYVGEYKIFATSTYQIVNKCRFNSNNGCSHNCSFDYMQLDFFCSCGKDDSLYLSPEDKKTCLSIYDVSSSTTTTSEIPLVSEFSSFSPSISEVVSSSPAPIVPLTSSEESASEHDLEEPTYQPEEEHNHHDVSEQPSYPISEEKFEYETSTEAELPSDISEPHSREHNHEEPETISVVSSTTTTTTTTTEASPEAISEEEIQPERIEDVSQPIVAPIETTTTTTTTSTTPTPEPLPILINSSEESHALPIDEGTTSHPGHSQEEEQVPVHHQSTEHQVSSDLHSSSKESTSEELGRTELDEIRPTDPVPIIPEESKSTSGENATIVETPRDVSSESEEKVEQVSIVSSTEAPVHVPIVEDVAETTVNPPSDQLSHEEVPVQQVTQEQVPVVEAPEKEASHEEGDHAQVPPVVPIPAEQEQETTTVLSGDDDIEGTTVSSEGEQDVSGDISPIDVLNFPSSKAATTSTTTLPVFDTHAHSGERSQGRSVSSGESNSEVESLSEGVTSGGPVRSQNLSEDESQTETSRDGRRLFTEDNSMQSLEVVDDKEKEREELVNPEEQSRSSQNVTETASVETADEKPEVALAVTKTSSNESDAASGEAVTQLSETDDVSSQSSQTSSGESGNNISGLFGSSNSAESSEISQESPVADSSESTTVPPRHLHHDIDINNLVNNTEDKVNSELVEVEGVQDDHVVVPEAQINTNDKLVEAPEEELPVPATTTIPELPAPVSAESLEKSDEFSGSTSRGIIGNADIFSSEDLSESPNRDHRDTEADIETPSSSNSAQEVQDEIVTTAVPLTSTSTTPTTTSTTTTTTTTTTSAPEVLLADITTTTTTTTTPVPVTTAVPIVSNNETETGSISSIISKQADSMPMESSLSASDEGRSSSSQLLSHESYSSSSSPEEDKSLVEPTEATSASFETGSLPSLESNSAGSSDDQQNELT